MWVVNATPRLFYSWETDPAPIVQQPGWAQGPDGRVRNISLPQGFDTWTFQPVASRFTDLAITTINNVYIIHNSMHHTW